MPKQEPSIRKPSKAKATAAAKPAAPKAKAAPKSRAASAGGARRAGNSSDRGERIRQRAYEIWEREGRPEGREQAHWEQAEREVAKTRSPRRQPTAG